MPEEPSEEDGARAEFEAMAERLRETVARRKAARVGIHRFRVISGKSVADAAGFFGALGFSAFGFLAGFSFSWPMSGKEISSSEISFALSPLGMVITPSVTPRST